MYAHVSYLPEVIFSNQLCKHFDLSKAFTNTDATREYRVLFEM
jgi:hypothetical protein